MDKRYSCIDSLEALRSARLENEHEMRVVEKRLKRSVKYTVDDVASLYGVASIIGGVSSVFSELSLLKGVYNFIMNILKDIFSDNEKKEQGG